MPITPELARKELAKRELARRASQPESFMPTGQDWLRSGQDYVGNMAQAVMHPLQTSQGVGNMALGAAQKLIPGQQPQEPYADAVGQYAQSRYGSFDKLLETWKHDPVGVIGDASMALTGGGGVVGKLPRMAKIGRMAAEAGALLDPLTVTAKAAGFAGRIPARVAEKSMKGLAGYEINSLIKPRNRQFAYAKNPGLAVAQEGIVASSLEELAQKATQRYQALGQQIGQMLQAPQVAGQRMNLSKVLDPIHNAIKKAKQNPRTNEMVIRRLENVRDDLLGVVVNPDGTTTVNRNLTAMSPMEAFELKKTIGELTKWTDQLSDDTVVNSAMKQAYGSTRSMIEQAVPGIKQINERFAGLLEASKAATWQSFNLQRHNPMSLTLPGAIAGGVGYASGGLPHAVMGVMLTQGAQAAVQSPLIRSSLASFIAHATPSEVQSLFNRIPGLQTELTRSILQAGTAQQRVTDQTGVPQ